MELKPFNFRGWPTNADANTRKPFDEMAPFHRINVPKERVPPGRDVQIVPAIDGKGYDCGCRSTKDYDGKIGKDLGTELAHLIENVFPVLKIPSAAAKVVSELIKKIPIVSVLVPKQVIEFLDDFDPFRDLLKEIGRAIDALLVDSLIRSVPLWVQVLNEQKSGPLSKELEIEGVLIRSFQRSDSMPLTQWHHWYDWTFKVAPIPFFEGTIGQGNMSRTRNDGDLPSKSEAALIRYDSELTPLGTAEEVINRTIDCEWDLGLIGQPPGPFFSPANSSVRDLAWPWTGQFFWAAGRSVYDCGHATTNLKQNENDPNKPFKTELEAGLHLNKLIPPKAIATARWEAHLFKENKKEVPAIQFMFFASNPTGIDFRSGISVPQKSAGDFRFDSLTDSDYEFIVDLPPLDQLPRPVYTIGRTPDFPMNTIVLRPRLLIDPVFTNFGNLASGSLKGDFSQAGPPPIVELLQPENPGELPKQVKIRVPLTQVNPQFNVYGVLLCMGWHDPDERLARKVKKVTVEVQEIRVGADAHESEAEWVVNVGVNGRWFQVERKGVRANQTIAQLGIKVTLPLSVDDIVTISAHGYEQDGFGDFFAEKPEINPGAPDGGLQQNPQNENEGLDLAVKEGFLKDRLLRFAKKVRVPKPGGAQGAPQFEEINIPFVGPSVQWKKDIEQTQTEIAKRDKKVASEVARAIFLRMGAGLALDANDILGFIDPDVQNPDPKKRARKRLNDNTDTANPLKVQDIVAEVGLGRFKQCRVTAYQTDVLGRMGNLVYDPNKVDYTLLYQVKVEDT